MEYWSEYTRFFTALLVIFDPFAGIPIFLSLTPGYTLEERSRAATLAAITVATVLSLAAMFGETMLTVLGTSLPSFRVGGGIVLLLIALTMLRAQPDQMRTTPADSCGNGNMVHPSSWHALSPSTPW